MNIMKRLIAVPLILVVTSGLVQASDILDGASLFSPEAIRQAESTFNRLETSSGNSVVIETVPTLDGRTIETVTLEKSKLHPSAALYILIAKKETKYRMREILARPSSAQAGEINAAFIDSLKKRDFDGALAQGSDRIASILATMPAAARGRAIPPGRRNGPVANRGGGGLSFLLTIGAIILVVLFVVRILGSLAGRGQAGYGPGMGMRPGMGGGYGGGGGGGFFSSMMGGIGGAMAGNWLYDQFRDRNHGSGYDSGNAGSYGNEPESIDGGGGDWGGGDTGGGGDWGGGGTDVGGGGGDWGGGGGGGDWS